MRLEVETMLRLFHDINLTLKNNRWELSDLEAFQNFLSIFQRDITKTINKAKGIKNEEAETKD